jgi:hypothetical protein
MGMIIGFTNAAGDIIERNIELFLWWNYSNPHIRI